ncbi:hypothetical protein [Actinokineospora cianjurensis]|uniref:hypothetical protein n=1 Tax=Actinokineospora cianjurensis TaxID=585224 RepID=UPI0014773618|nr:hypothetical protein [Actinokineospora cianjurensis]
MITKVAGSAPLIPWGDAFAADYSFSMACEPAKRGVLVPLITDPECRSGSLDDAPTECG